MATTVETHPAGRTPRAGPGRSSPSTARRSPATAATPSSTPPSASASTSRRCATSRACRPRRPAACASSRSRARARWSRAARPRSADGMVVQHQHREGARHAAPLPRAAAVSDHNSFCTPPCRDACPTHIKIPQFLDYIAHGDYKNGVRKLREDLPFPAVLGRVCPRPCEGPCRRQLVEHPITICWLHRFMADQTHRRGADRRAAAAGRAQARHRQEASPSWAAGPPASPPPSTPGSRATRSRSSRPCPSRAACCATASRATACRATCWTRSSTCCGAWASSSQCDTPPGRRLPARRAHGRATTPCSSPWAPSTATRWACPARTPTASSPRSTSSASSSSPATCHVGRQGRRHRRRLHRHGRLPHRRAQGRRRGHLPLPPLAQGDAGSRHRGRRGRGGGRQARAARARRCASSSTTTARSPASRCSAWSSASPTPPAAAARCRSRAPSSSSSATR